MGNGRQFKTDLRVVGWQAEVFRQTLALIVGFLGILSLNGGALEYINDQSYSVKASPYYAVIIHC